MGTDIPPTTSGGTRWRRSVPGQGGVARLGGEHALTLCLEAQARKAASGATEKNAEIGLLKCD